MKPSMSSLYFSELGPFQTVQLFAQHGWDHLELSECHAYDLVMQGDPARAGEEFGRFAADRGITFLQGHFPVRRYVHPDRGKGFEGWFDVAPESDLDSARAMELIRKWIDLFTAIGIRLGVLHMGGSYLKVAGWPDDAVFERRVETLTRIAEYAAGGGITICLENMSFPNSDVETVEQISTFASASGASNVAVCLDTGHALTMGVDCAEFILQAGGLVRALHIHENGGFSDDHELPYERGTIPWDRVLDALREVAYGGLFNFEASSQPWHPLPVRRARLDYARSLAAYMLALVHRSN